MLFKNCSIASSNPSVICPFSLGEIEFRTPFNLVSKNVKPQLLATTIIMGHGQFALQLSRVWLQLTMIEPIGQKLVSILEADIGRQLTVLYHVANSFAQVAPFFVLQMLNSIT